MAFRRLYFYKYKEAVLFFVSAVFSNNTGSANAQNSAILSLRYLNSVGPILKKLFCFKGSIFTFAPYCIWKLYFPIEKSNVCYKGVCVQLINELFFQFTFLVSSEITFTNVLLVLSCNGPALLFFTQYVIFIINFSSVSYCSAENDIIEDALVSS